MSGAFEVRLTRNAEKDILRLRGLTEKALREIMALEKEPSKGHELGGSLHGMRALKFSLKGVAYRAAYVLLENERLCLVFMVGPHEGFYTKAERRAGTVRREVEEK
jgi:mRNA interferase RelE/StbE